MKDIIKTILDVTNKTNDDKSLIIITDTAEHCIPINWIECIAYIKSNNSLSIVLKTCEEFTIKISSIDKISIE